MKKGIFISFEGPDGAGKTSVIEALVPELQALGQSVVTTREPGGVPIAERIREVILNPAHTAMDDKTELLLYIAARRQHMQERILPALESGQLLLVDRFIDSSVAYQGGGRGLDKSEIAWLNRFATDDLLPDLTIYLDVDAAVGLARIAKHRQHDMDRLDMTPVTVHERIRAAYLELVSAAPERIVSVDATQPLDKVVAACLAVIKQRFLT